MKLDPLKIAKIIGWLLLLSGMLGLLTSFSPSDIPLSLNLVLSALGIVTGIGLIKLKQWAIYCYGVGFLFNLYIQLFVRKSNFITSSIKAYAAALNAGPVFLIFPIIITIFGLLLMSLILYLFFLFYTNKEKFAK